MASGCSACISRDRRPAIGEARSALIRQVTLAGPKKPSSLVPSRTPDVNAAAERSIRPVAVAYRSAMSVKLTSSFAGIAAPDPSSSPPSGRAWPGLIGSPEPAHLLTRIGDDDCSRLVANDQMPATAVTGM